MDYLNGAFLPWKKQLLAHKRKLILVVIQHLIIVASSLRAHSMIGIVYKELRPAPRKLVQSFRTALQQEDLIMSPQNQNRVGNYAGLSLIADIEQLKDSHQKLEKLEDSHQELKDQQELKDSQQELKDSQARLGRKFDDFKAHCDIMHRDILDLRKFELWRYSSISCPTGPDPTDRLGRNTIAHGGHIQLDAEVCDRLVQGQDFQLNIGYSRATDGFQALYGISYPEYKFRYRNGPQAISDTLSIKANLLNLRYWNQMNMLQDRLWLLGTCDDILLDWLRCPSMETIPRINASYQDLKGFYDSIFLRIINKSTTTEAE